MGPKAAATQGQTGRLKPHVRGDCLLQNKLAAHVSEAQIASAILTCESLILACHLSSVLCLTRKSDKQHTTLQRSSRAAPPTVVQFCAIHRM